MLKVEKFKSVSFELSDYMDFNRWLLNSPKVSLMDKYIMVCSFLGLKWIMKLLS